MARGTARAAAPERRGRLSVVRHLSYAAMLAAVLAAVLPLERLLGTRVPARGRRLAVTVLLAGAPFVAWDLYATSRHHWRFDAAQTLSPRVAGLPLEEIGFFVVIPLAIVLTFEAVRATTGWDRDR